MWTVQEFVWALGRLGGHRNRPSDGIPGWQTPWRGLRELRAMLDYHQKATQLVVQVEGSRRPFARIHSPSKSVSRRSVRNMCPGLWVMANGGRLWSSTACGVTPQAQNTGTSPARTVTASP